MRGQSSFIDFIAGFFIFSIALAVSIGSITSSTQVDAPADTERVSNDLLSPGIPSDWNTSTVQVAGLLTEGNVNETKWNALATMDSENLTDVLRISSELRVRGLSFNGSDYELVLPTISTAVFDPDAETISRTDRVAAYNGSITVIEVTAWR